RPGIERLRNAYRDHFGPTGLAPIVEPLANDLGCCPIVTDHIVEMSMVHRRIEEVLQRRKLAIVAHEADGIERCRLQEDLDLVIVTVQPRARMFGRQSSDGMRGGE